MGRTKVVGRGRQWRQMGFLQSVGRLVGRLEDGVSGTGRNGLQLLSSVLHSARAVAAGAVFMGATGPSLLGEGGDLLARESEPSRDTAWGRTCKPPYGIIPIRKMREVVVPWVRLRILALGFHRDSVESVRDARGVRAHELCRKRLEMSVRRTGRGEGERHARRLALSWSGHCDEVVFCRGRREDGSSGQDEGCGGLHCDDSLLLVRVDESNVR